MPSKSGFLAVVGVAAAVAAMVYMLFFLPGDPRGDAVPADVILAHDKGSIPGFQQLYERQGEKAKQEIGIGFTPVPSWTTDLFINQMEASLPTRDAPELFVWWSTWRVRGLVEAGLVTDLTHLWDKHEADYPQEVRDAYTIDGRVYGFPYSIEYWPVFYNKAVFDRLGLSPPETWEEFIHVCEVLKDNGVDPILKSFQFDWYTVMWFAQLIIGQDPEFYVKLCEGEAAYDDPVVEAALGVYADMLRAGYFSSPSAKMFTNAGHLWNNERFGMVLCGSWYEKTVLVDQGVDEETIGAFVLPPRHPETQTAIMMESGPVFTARNAVNQDAAEAIADWWMSADGNRHFAEMFGSYSANTRVDTGYLSPGRKTLLSEIRGRDVKIVNRYWEGTPTPIVAQAMESVPAFILDPYKKAHVVEAMKNRADAYWETKEND